MMKRNKTHTLQLVMAVLMVLFGIGLIVASFIVPPTGEIHSSVLVAYGETLTFAGSLLGIDYIYKYKTHTNHHDNENEDEDK